MKNELGFRNVGVFTREEVWLEPNVFPYKYTNTSQPSHSSHLPAYEDGTDSVPKRRRIKFKRRGITQKIKILHQEPLKMRPMCSYLVTDWLPLPLYSFLFFFL